MRAALENMRNKQFLFLLWSMLLAVSRADAHHPAVSEYEVKAAFIHNIVKYMEWPKGTVAVVGVMRLCIAGEDPFGSATEILHDQPVADVNWQVVRVGADFDLRTCRVLFIAASESDRLGNILDAIKGSAVLTVGDTDGYAKRGVMVNFYLEAQKVRFEINQGAARKAGIVISSRLLRLARIV
jgi:hypothetical protein